MSISTPILSEDHILHCIDQFFPYKKEDRYINIGRGDDCAVCTIQKQLCTSTDMFIENVHFRLSYFTPEDIGWKALAVNISDLAACGAQPIGFSLGLALPSSTPIQTVEGICSGMSLLATQFNIPLLGGDISQSDNLTICITILGETSIPLLRAQSYVGDAIFMIGQVGLARTGLQILENKGREALPLFPEACNAHLRPFPLIKEAITLSTIAKNWTQQVPTPHRLSLIDISDGLAQDLPRLLGKSKGANITLPPPHPELIQFTHETCYEKQYSLDLHAFIGGEDYSLVGTCNPLFASVLKTLIQKNFFLLGYVTDSSHVSCNGNYAKGFDHFSHHMT